jgi:hypothetical protein
MPTSSNQELPHQLNNMGALEKIFGVWGLEVSK